jgi:hypothetical protein
MNDISKTYMNAAKSKTEMIVKVRVEDVFYAIRSHMSVLEGHWRQAGLRPHGGEVYSVIDLLKSLLNAEEELVEDSE